MRLTAIYLATAMTLCTVCACPVFAVDVIASAIVGPANQPYGVGTIEVPLLQPVIGQTLPPMTVTTQSGRVLYPVSDDVRVDIVRASERPVPQPGNGRLIGRLGKLIRELTDKDAPKTQVVARRITFLFTGQAPLQVRLNDGVSDLGVYPIEPISDPLQYPAALSQWWQSFTSKAKRQIDEGDYPPWVEMYLVAMLSGRTGNGLPDWFIAQSEIKDPLWATLQYLAGAEEVSQEVFRRTAAGLTDNNLPAGVQADPGAMQPLPAGPKWIRPALPPVKQDVETEPLAAMVPPECFYIRFGSFENYLWFLDLTTEYGGDLSRMVTLRGTAANSTKRFEEQLSLKINQLTRMLGPSVIADQAVIGRDLFTSDGASMGVLMQSKNAFLLRSSLANDRSSRASNDPSVTLKDVTIGQQKASLLSSPDNSVRSYLAEQDGFFLITNSKTLVKRFFEIGKSGVSLAATPSFQLSRTLVPTSRNDTIFAYFSPEMLEGLVSPRYLIELRRRSSADSDVSLVHLARLAAAAEGIRAENGELLGVEDLIQKGFLPVSFGNRSDGSGVISAGETIIDTMRGARGTFLPIADVEIDTVTPQESRWYAGIAAEYSQRFPQMDPIILALQRVDVPGDSGLERVSIHAEIAPLTPEKYGKWAKQLGPPTDVAVQFAPDDIATLQAHVASEQLGPPTHLFAGIKDTFPPEPEDFEGLLNAFRSLRQLPAYLGAWPQPGALDRLPLGLGRGRPVGPGTSRLLGGLYRYTGGGFSVLSFQPEVLNASLPFLEATEAPQPATVRGYVGSLLGSQLEGWVNNQLYQQSAKSSVAGAAFLDLLTDQLRVPDEKALGTAEVVLGAPLQCGLGGEYEVDPITRRWRSTAWAGSAPSSTPPPDYMSPLLHWFRGGDFTMTQYADRLVADGVITISRQPVE